VIDTVFLHFHSCHPYESPLTIYPLYCELHDQKIH
jgi:hypothetical protein